MSIHYQKIYFEKYPLLHPTGIQFLVNQGKIWGQITPGFWVVAQRFHEYLMGRSGSMTGTFQVSYVGGTTVKWA